MRCACTTHCVSKQDRKVSAMAAAKKKGKDDDGPKVYLGRPGNSVQIGIVGMPNVGKSSLFNIMSKLNVAAENYPFCTIDPNVSRVPVPDERFDFLVDVHKPKSVVPAVLAVTDIAGLVKGAAAGQGLGNAFLSHISAVDGIFHVCRAFNDKDVEHVEATVDPVRDLEIISNELRLKDLEKVEREKKIAEDRVNRGIDKTKPAIEKKDILIKVHEMLTNGKDIRNGDWKPKDVDVLNELLLLSAKPVVYLVNVSEKDYIRKGNKWLVKIFEWVKANSPGSPIIPFSITYETKHLEMSVDDQKKFEEETKSQSKIPKIITTGYDALDLIHFFTSGSDEVRAWTVRKGSKAPQAAGVIHTDFEKGFIMAETMSFEDFKKHGSEAACKAAGRYRMEGKNYTVQDGDIFFFKFNAAGGAKKK